MLFSKKANGYIIEHKNGRIERCETLRELREVCHMMVEIGRTLGKIKAPGKARWATCGIILGKRGDGKKKKVRINILPDERVAQKEKTPHKSLAAGCGV